MIKTSENEKLKCKNCDEEFDAKDTGILPCDDCEEYVCNDCVEMVEDKRYCPDCIDGHNWKEKFQSIAESSLEKAVVEISLNHLEDDFGKEELKQWFEDVQHGCSSGVVGELIYYEDTLKFYKDYQSDINALLKESMQSTGITEISKLLQGWDEEDPLALDTCNQNILAWFGFEETCFQMASKLGIDI